MRPVLTLVLFVAACSPPPPGLSNGRTKTPANPPAAPAPQAGMPALSFASAAPAGLSAVDTSQTGGWTETSPWTIGVGDQHGYLISTDFTIFCTGAGSLSDAANASLSPSHCVRILAGGTSDLPNPSQLDAPEWRRNYYGSFTAHRLEPDNAGSALLLFAHGENKNESVGDLVYENTINPGVNNYSGYDENGEYVDAWDAYNAFIGSVVLANPTALATDEPLVQDNGPVVWPAMGYLDAAGNKTSQGVRHPSSIVDGGYVYLFYLDTSRGDDPERAPGIKVARAPLADAGAPGSFRAYFAGSFGEAALPDGYSAGDLHASLAQPGPRSTAILGSDSANDVRFSVARVSPSPTGSSLYLGVEEHFDDQSGWWLALRVSSNLTDWSPPYPIPGVDAPTWDDGMLNYPILMDQNGWTNTSISLERFFVVGTSSSQTNVLPLSVDVRVP